MKTTPPGSLSRPTPPSLPEAPDFWISEWNAVQKFLDSGRQGQVWEFGRSQGGHPLRALAYGKREPIDRKTSLAAACLSGHLEDFFHPDQRKRPVVLVISTIHGAEIEGCISCLNLAQIIESGDDLRGRRWERLAALCSGLRVVLVPLAQPDGRLRCPVRHFVGAGMEDLFYYGQGEWKDPPHSAIERSFLRRTPVPLEEVSHLGGYYNDAGINIDLDDFLSPAMAPESAALLDLARTETPDAILVLHSHGPGPWISAPNAFVSPRCQYHQAQVRALVAHRHQEAGLRPKWHPQVGPPAYGYFNLPTALYHVSGALPLAFEFPHGLKTTPYTFDEILDIGLTLFEEVFAYVAACAYRPGQFTHNAHGLREIPEVCRRPPADA